MKNVLLFFIILTGFDNNQIRVNVDDISTYEAILFKQDGSPYNSKVRFKNGDYIEFKEDVDDIDLLINGDVSKCPKK